MINQKVKLKPSLAKWHLDHPEVYEFNGQFTGNYETDTLIHLICCLGEPIYGKIIREGNSGCWLVKWKIDDLSAQYYVSRHHFDINKLYKLVNNDKP